MRRTLLVTGLVALLSLLSALATAQDIALTLVDGNAASATMELENTYDFDVKVVNLRVTFEEPDGSDIHYYSDRGLNVDLAPGETWEGELRFATTDGTRPDDATDWGNYERLSSASGIDINAFAPAIEAAISALEFDAIAEQLAFVKSRIVPVSRAARFHGDQIAISGVDPAQWFDLERMDGFRDRLENAICEIGSTEVLALRGSQETKQEEYNLIAERMRTAGMHINCINSPAKLAAARMLLAGSRPQDALLFKEVDEDGNLLEEWRPIFIEANLALARTAAELNLQAFSSIRPALLALNEVLELDPENAAMQVIANTLIPNAATWIVRASGPIERDIDNAQAALELLRPRWSRFEQVERAAEVFADALIAEGIGYCERREYVNARNRFIRGERLLDGIEAWDANADRINHCRALGALEEGRETARHPTDESGPARGFLMLEEAQQRYPITLREINAFKADISAAWAAVATRQLEEEPPRHESAAGSLREAEEVSPTGRTDAIRTVWILYAERRYDYEGILMRGAEIQDAREALEKAEEVDPDRISAASRELSLAFYGYRVGIPFGAFLLALLGFVFHLMNKSKAKKFAALSDDDF